MGHGQAEILHWELYTTHFYLKCVKAVLKKKRVLRDENENHIIFKVEGILENI